MPSNDKFFIEALLKQLPTHIYWKNCNGIYLGCSDSQAKIYGFNSGVDVIGKSEFDLISARDAQKTNDNDQEVLKSGQPITLEENITLPSGYNANYLSVKTPVYDTNGTLLGLIGISIDITAQKKAEEREKTALAEKQTLENQVQLYKQLSATVAHELITPLKSIQLGAEAIQANQSKLINAYQVAKKADLVKDKIANYILRDLEEVPELMAKEIDYAFLFITMLRANIHADKLETGNLIQLQIQDIVSDAIARYPFDDQQKQKIHNKIQHNFAFLGDEIMITHVLFNLFKNAIYYIEKASKGEITIWTETSEDFNKLYFKDTGTGIEPEILPHIFDRFFTRTLHGTGIGLTYCKMVMESFGGNITCRSNLGEYTEFVLTFPKITSTL